MKDKGRVGVIFDKCAIWDFMSALSWLVDFISLLQIVGL